MKRVPFTLNRLLPSLLLLLYAARGLAGALPDALSYQGYLTDTSGTPLDTTVSITFSLYNAAIGGTPAWTETQSVPISKGLFTVQMGNTANPLPGFLFSNPVWLGVKVGADNEMTPRKAMTSVGFAFRAERVDNDADTLATLQCTIGQVAKYDGGNWVCAADVGENTGQVNVLGTITIEEPGGQPTSFNVVGMHLAVIKNAGTTTASIFVSLDTSGGADISYLYSLFNDHQLPNPPRIKAIIDLPQNEVSFELDGALIGSIGYAPDESLSYPNRTQAYLDLSIFQMLTISTQSHRVVWDKLGGKVDPCVAYANYSNTEHIAGMPDGTGKYEQLRMDNSTAGSHFLLDGLHSGNDAACFVGATASATPQDVTGPVVVTVKDPATKTLLSTLELDQGVLIDQYVLDLSLEGMRQELGFVYGRLRIQ